LPACEIKKTEGSVGLVEALGLKAFTLFKQKKMALFFIFSMMLGMCLQVTNSYANPFITSFGAIEKFADTFGVQHANILISISQICEALCILAIPFFLKRFGIKNVMLMAMFAWVFRFGFFGAGDPGFPGVILFILSCIVYGFAFDFFNISGALYVDQETEEAQRSSAQGLFMMMTNGLGATIGMLSAQGIVNSLVISQTEPMAIWAGWREAWFIFAGFALCVAILFWILFPQTPVNKDIEVKH
jgi:nucleoside transporter